MPDSTAKSTARPSVFTIPAGTSFVEALATGILKDYGDDPVALSRLRILLPNRRAVRTLREAFLRQGEGRPLILPSMQPLGDVDEEELALTGRLAGAEAALELPPAIPALKRTMLLSPLVSRLRRIRGDENADDPASSFMLAAELGRFLDQVQTEECSLVDLAGLVPDNFAAHWQITLEFLDILGTHWPGVLAEQGYLDPADRRNRVLRALADEWTATPPDYPVIVAGSTGSIPASAALIKAVSFMPEGSVVLPGLDRNMDPASWDVLSASHPQYGLKQLLSRMGVDHAEVKPWPGDSAPENPARVRLLGEAMRPAKTIEDWQAIKLDFAGALEGLYRVDAPTRQSEAGAIALILREALDVPGRTAALVTPDRELARRVASAMTRWGIEIDDSAGTPLRESPPGVFMRLIAEAVLEDFAPVPLLAVLKHPLCSAGLGTGPFRAHVRQLELAVLRGPRPAPGLNGISAALHSAEAEPALLSWWDDLAARWQTFTALFDQASLPAAELLNAHVELAVSLSESDDRSGDENLWRGDDGEALSVFLSEFNDAIKTVPPVEPYQYPAFFDMALFEPVVRPAYGTHPRLAILGPLEARLHHADVMVLGSLNEESWPPDTGADPWMSRPMRARFGLSPPERRIGLSAHDFVQGASAPVVYLTRAEKIGGAPTLPSRWLLRLDAVLGERVVPQAPHLHWASAIDAAAYEKPDEAGPQPVPSLDARPRQLSVTQIETWMRDPYELYAKKILGFRPLDALDEEPGASDRGNFIHDTLDRFLKENPPPEQALERLLALGREEFGAMLDRPLVQAFWWPRFEQIARWFLEQQEKRAGIATPVATEHTGTLVVDDLPEGDFVLTAKADRIDQLAGGYEIIDYKTGRVPTGRQLLAGYAAQMPLEAAMLMQGAFPGIEPSAVGDLSWWVLKGSADKNEAKSALKFKEIDSIDDLAANALVGLRRLVSAFDNPKTPYLSRPDPTEKGFGDYDHLARIKEWGA